MLSMGKSTISMAIFNSYVKLPEGIGIRSNIQLTQGTDFVTKDLTHSHIVSQGRQKSAP